MSGTIFIYRYLAFNCGYSNALTKNIISILKSKNVHKILVIKVRIEKKNRLKMVDSSSGGAAAYSKMTNILTLTRATFLNFLFSIFIDKSIKHRVEKRLYTTFKTN